MNTDVLSSKRSDRWRALAAAMCAALLVACGGGGGSGDDGTDPPPPPPPPPAPASRCIDPTPDVSSTVRFATPVAPAASSVEVSGNGLSACFLGAAAAGAKSDVALATGEASFYYFEARRSQLAGVSFGVSASAETAPPTGGFVPRADTLVISGTDVVAGSSSLTGAAGDGAVFGFAVDMRASYPVISVIAPASVNTTACAGLPANAPCVVLRRQLTSAASTLAIYAYGGGDGIHGPRVSINTGGDHTHHPFAYSTADVLAALRASRPHGDRGFNAQWPGSGGPASVPTLTRASSERAVIRQGDAAPAPATFTVTPTNAAGGSINWRDDAGALYPAGASLPLNSPLIGVLAVGEHMLRASVLNPQTGRYGETTFRLRVVAAGDNADHDGDGLTYDDEKIGGLEPGNADTDGDGLADGAELELGTNPLVPDNDPAVASLPRGALVHEPGTSRGLILDDDSLSVTFTSELNPACVAHVAPFDDPVYSNSSFGAEERCRKRAIRANVGIAPGEFRYFETQRLGAVLNFGHGVITPDAQIDPYCCYVDPLDPGYDPDAPYPGTPPSLAVNSIGGVFRRLEQIDAGFNPAYDPDQTQYYGFAVDYTGIEPKVHIVMNDASGTMTVSQAVGGLGFDANVNVVPMLYGHTDEPNAPSSRINLGLQRFHHDLAAIKTALQGQGIDTTQFKPGVGAHRWRP